MFRLGRKPGQPNTRNKNIQCESSPASRSYDSQKMAVMPQAHFSKLKCSKCIIWQFANLASGSASCILLCLYHVHGDLHCGFCMHYIDAWTHCCSETLLLWPLTWFPTSYHHKNEIDTRSPQNVQPLPRASTILDASLRCNENNRQFILGAGNKKLPVCHGLWSNIRKTCVRQSWKKWTTSQTNQWRYQYTP